MGPESTPEQSQQRLILPQLPPLTLKFGVISQPAA
ncbi:hypothetical protein HNE_2239 [Hyphomonas neptunium ATCC 15444]|uniref:Uncharacterized protein n=2 Tax=Hyphomonas TaxID=85 RepID=Q0C009_HYPNA|nr:hypothetical protein HNE_2239 [Hyphomonas neptunium ATCC 15444]KCZ86623.1 hypothetical protein HHI_17131 [Hyphomonas hirschiana VP5]